MTAKLLYIGRACTWILFLGVLSICYAWLPEHFFLSILDQKISKGQFFYSCLAVFLTLQILTFCIRKIYAIRYSNICTTRLHTLISCLFICINLVLTCFISLISTQPMLYTGFLQNFLYVLIVATILIILSIIGLTCMYLRKILSKNFVQQQN